MLLVCRSWTELSKTPYSYSRERESTGFWNIWYECLENGPPPIEKGYGLVSIKSVSVSVSVSLQWEGPSMRGSILFLFQAAQSRERTSTKMHSIECRFVIEQSNILFAGVYVYVCTFQPGKCTACRCVRASFSPEILQAGAVKGLIQNEWGLAPMM